MTGFGATVLFGKAEGVGFAMDGVADLPNEILIAGFEYVNPYARRSIQSLSGTYLALTVAVFVVPSWYATSTRAYPEASCGVTPQSCRTSWPRIFTSNQPSTTVLPSS